MSTIEGAVEAVNFVNGPATASGDPKWKKVSVKVKGEWYGGFINAKDTDDRATVAEGNIVSLSFSKNGRYLNIDNLKVVARAVVEKKDKEPTTKTTTTTVQEYVPSNLRDLRITVAGSRNSAIEFVRLALDKEVIALKAKKAGERVDELFEHVNHYTEVFAKQLLTADDKNLLGVVEKQDSTVKEADDYTE